MHYFFQDLTGVAAATLLALVLIVAPGFGVARLMIRAGLIGEDRGTATCWGLILGPTLLPAVDALLLRWSGFAGPLLLHAALAAYGARAALDMVRRVPLRWWAVIAPGWFAVVWANVDFDWNNRLYQTVLVNDTVKHAAVIGALAQYGVPLHDPFVARPGIAGYYYYFYLGPALLHWLGGALIDSRAAFAAGSFVTMLAFPALLILVADCAGLIAEGARRRFLALTVLLCCVSGFDLPAGLWIWIRTGKVLAQLDWWSEEVRWALTSFLWVPHHLTAVMAVFTGCLILTASGRTALLPRAALAGAAFASAFGCSLWIALAAAPILGLWWLVERIRTGAASMWALPLSGLIALLLSAPQIGDIAAGRTMTGPPVAFYMRPLGPVRVLPHGLVEWIVHLAVTPGGFAIEFGVFAVGTVIFFRRQGLASAAATPIGRLLLVSAPVALVLVTFLRSAILYNDFGWRAVWFAQLPAMVWTAAALCARREAVTCSPMWSAALSLGLAATLWDLTGIRLISPRYFFPFINPHPDVDYDLRGAYAWAARALPAKLVLQHNPAQAARALDFGLYRDHPVAVSDAEARLFGADQSLVENRLSLLTPIFERPMPAAELRRRAAAAGVGAVVLTSADPLWRKGGGPPASWTCRYRSANSCVMVVEKPQ